MLGNNSYERLCDSKSSLALSELSDDGEEIKEADVDFYNDDGSCKTIVVEENLRTSDLCQLLALKNHVAKDSNWSVVEYLDELGLGKSEDFDNQIKSYWIINSMFCARRKKSGGSRRNFENNFVMATKKTIHFLLQQQWIIKSKSEPPKIFSHLWIQWNLQELWKKAFFVLYKNILYYSFTSKITDPSKLSVCADLHDYNVYSFEKGGKYFKIPTEFCFCLKFHDQARNVEAKNIFFACDNDKIRTCWIAGLRLAKYGKQLRDNFKNVQSRINRNGKDFSSLKVISDESTRSRVAMDFTGDRGRIVEDPNRARAIAESEGFNRNKKVLQRKSSSVSSVMGLAYGVHITQPWFHNGLTREEAIQLLTKHGTVNGVFLVRNKSHSTPNTFVLSFVYSDKIYHTQIKPIEDNEQIVFSMDEGKTKFYDVLQLVEFHQLNHGCLPTRLTHYIVQIKSLLKESP
uniref:SH2 domain-containing protein n=1 Tax=Strigamia maritima TaxID=126957 RepID=T1JAA8_STRMM